MRSLRHLLPSAGSLIVFEAAGRLSSFTAAGRELGMTQAAVSYAVRGLEEKLGAKLFQRRHRQVSLTEAGERFHADVSLGLSHIRKSAEDLRQQATGGHVTLAASTAFGSFWMMPRLQQFRDELPGIDLRIQTADRDLDIIAEGIPLAVRGGEPREWPDYHCLPLADEEIFPVAGASYVAKFGLPQTVEELASHRLIHLEEPFREAASWEEWFHSAGASLKEADAGRGLRINDYALVIQAVMEGQGIALGWRHLAERLLASGLLVSATSHVMRTGTRFYIIWPKNRELSDNARKVRDWLAAQA
ncbi:MULTISPECIES: LysR substrate-binding domain-containing protein [unclassified Mesorhizobium]|uniref:LysR substrate-binding domain-containing protein n=1 Tax=unclassified Mesorhizobium TaxID=325217 RepID=UPI000F762CC1|nr:MULTISPECIES: LysR substrate-binding domain-containing protein [unclassified Mesorhizobium]AZO68997.1 LysR family transcriptional regulator [Mesorhizobium sp. M6A.T.Cr.TU.016.01.1.1]RUU45114.1 LysR family transcriptional regulator [Mesorhizobium sp. M6A.T.Ce.TU.002.03.1.1]RVB73630.1 LysR family transcriptional regulator [Mesorhizobium sp. M6A.T.Cr.TU.014.01.1.1]RWO95806.1 MAG: LysR family transcriptional regulator [Mesorhizobium sp.]RWP45555.1 MAG: LysR family transcriptional regulator [Mes